MTCVWRNSDDPDEPADPNPYTDATTNTDLVKTLGRLDEYGIVVIAAGGETFRCEAVRFESSADHLTVIATEVDGDREFRIESQYLDGWLDPQVDVREESDEWRPLGQLHRIRTTG